MAKPIRIFYSPLSKRLYASRAYKEMAPGVMVVTGEKFDVSDEIGAIITKHELVFTPVKKKAKK